MILLFCIKKISNIFESDQKNVNFNHLVRKSIPREATTITRNKDEMEIHIRDTTQFRIRLLFTFVIGLLILSRFSVGIEAQTSSPSCSEIADCSECVNSTLGKWIDNFYYQILVFQLPILICRVWILCIWLGDWVFQCIIQQLLLFVAGIAK